MRDPLLKAILDISYISLNNLIFRFICLVKKRHQALRQEHEQMAAALQTIERGTQLAEQLKAQLGHEKMVLEQKKEVCSACRDWS